MGIVYVLSNAAMPGLVKIGMTEDSDASTRVGQLFSTGVPLPFDVEYACRVDNPDEVEGALHRAFAPHRINPRREFFRIAPEQAVAILKLLNKPDATAEVAKPSVEVDATSVAAAEQARARRPNLSFKEMGIPEGSVLEADADPNIKLTVVGDKKVKFGDEEFFFTAGSQKALNLEYPVRPALLWRFNGKLISEIYEDTYGE